MIFVDTSVWVQALDRGDVPLAERLRLLLENDEVALAAPARLELLAGAARRDREFLQDRLSAVPIVFPAESTWWLAEEWIDRAAAAGHRFGFGDLLIGAIAAEQGGSVWSLDSDFARMETLGLIRRFKASRPL